MHRRRTPHTLKKHLSYGAFTAFILSLTLMQIHGDHRAYQANVMNYKEASPVVEAPLRDTMTLSYKDQSKSFTMQELGILTKASNPNFFERIFKKNPKQNYSWNEERSAHILHEAFAIQKPSELEVVWNGTDMQVTGGEASEKILVQESFASALHMEGQGELKTLGVAEKDPSLALSFESFAEKLVQEGWTINYKTESFNLAMTPQALVWNQSVEGLRPSLSDEKIQELLDAMQTKWAQEKQDVRLLEIADTEKSSKMKIEGLPRAGLSLDRDATHAALLQAVQNRETSVEASFLEEEASLINETPVALPSMQELGRGISNYKGTDAGRIHNVEKAVNEVYHAIYIPQGQDFSFNKLLGPVTNSAGWKNANIIVNGKDLKKAPGGGVCQAASTIFRAALDAGLPISKQKNHSLYVNYYTQKAVEDNRVYDGLDATIYPGLQDLVFTNDTAGPMIMLSFTDENRDVHVRLYAQEQEREVHLVGPVSASNQDEASVQTIGKLNRSSLAWKQIIEKDGEIVEKWFISRYRGAVKQY